MSYANSVALVRNTVFRDVCVAAMIKKVRALLGAVQAGTATYPPRVVEYAKNITLNPTGVQETLAWVVATDPTVATAGLPDPAVPGSGYTEAMIDSAITNTFTFLAQT